MYYNKVGQYIDIKGNVSGDSVKMQGTSPDGKIYDIFSGKISGKAITGIWLNPQSGRKYPFEVLRSNNHCVLLKNFTLEKKDSAKIKGDYATFSYKFDGVYPVAAPRKGIEKRLMKEIYGHDSLPIEKIVKLDLDSLYSDWKQFYITDPDIYSVDEASNDFNRTIDVAYNSNCFLTLVFDSYEFTGGAHGYFARYYESFDAMDGHKVKYSEVFAVDTSVLLEQAILPALVAWHKENCEDEELPEEGLPFPDGWGIGRDGILVIYDPYSIFSYACGLVDIEIPYQKLKKYLTEDFKKRMGL